MEGRPETYVIKDLQQIKAVADPLRQQILGAFLSVPRTTKQVATLLGQPATKLYHHVDLLERVGLLKLDHTKPKRGTTERYLLAVANRFALAEGSLVGEAVSVVEASFGEAFTAALAELRQSLTGGKEEQNAVARTAMALGMLRLDPKDLPKLERRLTDVAKEFAKDRKSKSARSFRFLFAIYPAADSE